MKQRVFRWFFVILVVVVALVLVIAAAAINLEEKEYAEGDGAAGTGSILQSGTQREYVEGAGYSAAGSRVGGSIATYRGSVEGQAGSSGRASFPDGNAWAVLSPAADLIEVYRFSGVSDDGEQGSANRKEATSIHCTNTSAADNEVEVQVYQWNGTDVFTGTVTMPPNRTFTFSTQNTTIYFDDVILGGVPGTDPVFQGSGQILSESADIICSAQVLDPLNYPPIFATKLTMYHRDGTLVGDDREVFLPVVLRP